MNITKVSCDFLSTSLTLDNLAKKYSVDKADIVKAIRKFCNTYPESQLYPKLDRKLKIVLIKDFLTSSCRREDFAMAYGMNEKTFVALMKECIEDYSLVPYDTLANKMFLRLTLYHTYSVPSIPKRIIRIMAEYYVNPEEIYTQDALAHMYGIRDFTISCALRRGIAEGILNDELADMVYARVRNCKYATNSMLKAYREAFDQREKLN